VENLFPGACCFNLGFCWEGCDGVLLGRFGVLAVGIGVWFGIYCVAWRVMFGCRCLGGWRFGLAFLRMCVFSWEVFLESCRWAFYGGFFACLVPMFCVWGVYVVVGWSVRGCQAYRWCGLVVVVLLVGGWVTFLFIAFSVLGCFFWSG